MYSQSMPFTLASLKNMKHFKYGICNIILPLTYQQDIFFKETTANVKEKSIAKYLIFKKSLVHCGWTKTFVDFY